MVSMKMIIWSHFKQTDSDLVRGRSRDQNTVFFFKSYELPLSEHKFCI